MHDILTAVLTAIMPQLLELIAVVASILATVAIRQLSKWLGLRIEGQHREALHRAITTGIVSALSAGFDKRAAISAAVQYARSSVPDAVKALKPTEAVLLDIANAKLTEVGGQTLSERLPGAHR